MALDEKAHDHASTAGSVSLSQEVAAAAEGMGAGPVPDDVPEKHARSLSATASTSASVGSDAANRTKDVSQLEKGLGSAEASATQDDSNIVDFDGPDDPAKAVNWSSKRKWLTIACLSAMTFITPLASSMFAPGVPEVLADFQSDSEILGAFVVSVYVLGYAAGPMFIAPLSELYGRLPLYHSTNVTFVIFTIACAVSTNLNMLIGFRFLAGFAGSAAITMGGGTVADLFVQEQRGKAMALWSMGPLLGPVVGPICGGFLADDVGWRWVFWVITIAAGVVSLSYLIFVRETYAPIILERKTKRLRKETGNKKLRPKGTTDETPGQLFARSIVRPLKMMLLSPIVFLLSLYMAVCYGYLYLLFTTITNVFIYDYDFNEGIVGLVYIGIGVGMFSGLIVVGGLSDRILKKKAAGGEMKPEYRLPFMVPGAFAMPIGLFLYGWTAQYRVFWFVPILGTSFVGFGLISVFMAINTYLVDAFTLHAASAIAANTIFRSVVGALLPLAGPAMYSRLGLGWGNSVLGFIAVVLIAIPFGFLKYGEFLRTNPRFQLKL